MGKKNSNTKKSLKKSNKIYNFKVNPTIDTILVDQNTINEEINKPSSYRP